MIFHKIHKKGITESIKINQKLFAVERKEIQAAGSFAFYTTSNTHRLMAIMMIAYISQVYVKIHSLVSFDQG